MSATILEMPSINFSATKQLILEKKNTYNENKKLGDKIRDHHIHDLWRLVEYFAYRMMDDNKTQPVSTRRIKLETPERVLWTDKLTRQNMKEWFHVECLHTVGRRLQRLAKAGFINMTARSEDKKHITSIIELNKDIVALEDILNPNLKNHDKKSLKTRSNELKMDSKKVKSRFTDNQATSLSNGTSCSPLLNTTKHNNLTNKLIEKGGFSEKSEKQLSVFQNSANSANPSPRTPNQGNSERVAKENRKNYSEKIQGSKKQNRFQAQEKKSKEEILEDYRRSMAEHVFRESLGLWAHRNDVYEGEYRKAGLYVADNYFRSCTTIKQIDSAVEKVLWCLKFQKNRAKDSKLEENKEQFVFYPHKYFSGHGTGSLKGIEKFYRGYKNGHEMPAYERAAKKIKYRKIEKNFAKEHRAIKKYVEGFLSGKRNNKARAHYEGLIKKNYPNKPKYIISFNKMVRIHLAL